MRPPQIIPVEELGKAALLCDAVGGWAQIDPFVLHGPPQALDKDVVVTAPASIHADLDPVIPQHRGERVAGELRALIGIEDAGACARCPVDCCPCEPDRREHSMCTPKCARYVPTQPGQRG